MLEAFEFYFEGSVKRHAKKIRLDGDIFGDNMEPGKFFTPKGRELKAQRGRYIDERSKKEFDQFSKYFLDTK